MFETKKQSTISKLVLTSLFILYVFWWVVTKLFESEILYIAWGVSYWIFAVLGTIAGCFIAKKWGGYRSIFGRTIYAFSAGLLLQAVGQNFTNYYILNDLEIYPSWADLGFFGSIPFYIYGSFLLTKIAGLSIALRSWKNRFFGLFLFILMLSVSYFFLLSQVNYDWSHPMLILLDFGYPFGQAIFVSFAIVTLFLTKGILGGLMRKSILLLLLALFMQFLADYAFSILLGNDAWVAGGLNDIMYLSAYYLMSYAILEIYSSFNRIQKS